VTTHDRPDAVVRAFLDDTRMRGLSQKTTYNCQLTLGRLARWAATEGRPPVLYLTTSDLLDWARAQRQCLPQTLHGYLVQLRMFYAWALTRGLLDVDPVLRIELPKLPDRLPDPVPEDVYRQVMGPAETDMAAILGLAGFCGLRACEIAWLPWSGVRFTDMRLRVRGKGGRERILPLEPGPAELLAALPKRSGPVIPRRDGERGHNEPHTISHRANAYLHDQGCPWTLHKLRHRFATVGLAATGNIAAVSESLGHKRIQTTHDIYARSSIDQLRAVTEAAGRFVA
jgi:integrase/recombinase XerC